MSLGIFVEGQSDKKAIPILIKKLGYADAIKTRIVRQGQMLDESRMLHHVDALFTDQPKVSRIIVFMDSEGVDPKTTLRSTTSVSSALTASSGVRVDYVIVDHALEGWLACDIDALRAVLGTGAKIQIRGNPEDNLRPAKLMERIFKANRKNYVKTVHAAKIAEAATASSIAKKSPTFRRLKRVLRQRAA